MNAYSKLTVPEVDEHVSRYGVEVIVLSAGLYNFIVWRVQQNLHCHVDLDQAP